MKRSWKASLYDRLFTLTYPTKLHTYRKQTVRHAYGKVLEVGSGTGLNFPYYTDQVEHVYAVEPDDAMRNASLAKVKHAPVLITPIAARAEQLPFANEIFDTVISTLVFCTIPKPHDALAELKRVAKENARFYFLEHVKVTNPFLAKMQDVLNPCWKRIAGGCHLNRDTRSIIEASGFHIIEIKQFYRGLFIQIIASKKAEETSLTTTLSTNY